MNAISKNRFSLPASVVFLLGLAAPTAVAQNSYYLVRKVQGFAQTSGAGVIADPNQAFEFTAAASTSATLTLPTGGTQALLFVPGDREYRFDQFFATKGALDAAFPNGTYRLTGTGIPALSSNLSTEAYPVAIPQVTGGTWNAGGLLVIDPTQSTTINFSSNSSFATSGVLGQMNFNLRGINDTLSLETAIVSQANPFGIAVQTAPFTSFAIPAGRLTSGRAYRAQLSFNTFTSLDTTSVAGGAAVGVFGRSLYFFVAAQAPGTSTPPPVLVAPPTNQVGALGGTATFNLTISVGGSIQNTGQFAQWYFNGREILFFDRSKYDNSTTGFGLTIRNLTAADAGIYSVTVVNAGGIVNSLPATLTLSTPTAPLIATQPRSVTVNAGSTVALAVTASGSPTPTYQWRKDGVALNGATADTFVLGAITAAAAGNYTVAVTNSVGTTTSTTATVTVTSGQPSRLPNLSVRTNLGTGLTLILGFATIGPKDMLVRGIGPTLGSFGLTGVLPDPRIELYNSASAKIDENDDWSPSLAPVFADVGAFALTAGSKDAALLRTSTGANTAQIRSGGAGVVLVEVYDAGGTGKLVNVSARNAVGTGDNVLIAGFVVTGTAAKTLLIRGVGAKLAEFGVSGVLADPKLEIYNSAGEKIAENDSWGALLQPIARGVGAFDLTLGSRDAALLLTLSPGSYTAQISGVGGTTGEAIVEVYEVP